MPDTTEHMPNLIRADRARGDGFYWLENLRPNRRTDLMLWTPPGDGSDLVEFSPAQLRHLHARLSAILPTLPEEA